MEEEKKIATKMTSRGEDGFATACLVSGCSLELWEMLDRRRANFQPASPSWTGTRDRDLDLGLVRIHTGEVNSTGDGN